MKRVQFQAAAVKQARIEEVSRQKRTLDEEEEEEFTPSSKRHQNEDDDAEEEEGFTRWNEDDIDAAGERYRSEDIEQLEEAKMERFNMDEERELGNFDSSGTFTWKRKDLLNGAGADEDGGDEAWLAQIGDQTVAKQQKIEEEEARPPPQSEVMQSMWQVVRLLANDNENSFDALKRLGTSANKQDFNQLTDACDQILNCGLAEVYSLPRKVLVSKMNPVYWEYRVVNGDGEVFGPFPGNDMQQWRDEAGFFQKDSNEYCQVRSTDPRTGRKSDWRFVDQVESFLLLL